jgi:hypothetical protein
LPKRNIVISPKRNAASTEVLRNTIPCRREPRTPGGEGAISAATAIPPPPNSGPPQARIRTYSKRLSIARSAHSSSEEIAADSHPIGRSSVSS